MRRTRLPGWFTLGTAMLVLVAGSTDTRAQTARTSTAKATLSPANEGRRDFLKWNCYSCHGMDASGGMGPNIQQAESSDLSEAVLDGEDGGMPSFRHSATATDIRNIAAYLATIGTPQEPKWVDWWNPVPGHRR